MNRLTVSNQLCKTGPLRTLLMSSEAYIPVTLETDGAQDSWENWRAKKLTHMLPLTPPPPHHPTPPIHTHFHKAQSLVESPRGI